MQMKPDLLSSSQHPIIQVSSGYHQNITSLTNKLQVKPDLMHPPSVGTAENNTGRSIEAQTLKLSPALFSSSDQNRDLWISDVFLTNQPFTKKRWCCLSWPPYYAYTWKVKIPGNFAHPDLVAEHLYWLSAVNHSSGKQQQCQSNSICKFFVRATIRH